MEQETLSAIAALSRVETSDARFATEALAAIEEAALAEPDADALLTALLDRCPAVPDAATQRALLRVALRLARATRRLEEATRVLSGPGARFALESAAPEMLREDEAFLPVIARLFADLAREPDKRRSLFGRCAAERPDLFEALCDKARRERMTDGDLCRSLQWLSFEPGPWAERVVRWLAGVLREGDDDARHEAATGLLRARADEGPLALSALRMAVDDPAGSVARTSAMGVVARAIPQGLAALDPLLRDPRAALRCAAVEALSHGAVRGPAALARAVAAMGDDAGEVRARAAVAVTAMAPSVPADDEVFAAVRAVGASLTDRPLEASAAEALSLVGSDAPRAERLLRSLPVEAPGVHFARLHGALARVARGEPSLDCPVCARCGRTCNGEESTVYAAAAPLAPPVPHEDVQGFVTRCPSCGVAYSFERSSEWDIAERVSVSLTRLSYAGALAVLRGEDREALVRRRDELCARWREQLEHPRRWVRREAVWNLCELARSEGRWDAHAELLAHHDPTVRAEVLVLLGDRPTVEGATPALVRALVTATDEEDPKGRADAVSVLTKLRLGRGEVAPVFDDVLREADHARRAAMLRTLRVTKLDAVLEGAPRVLPLLRATDRETRDAATGLLAHAAAEDALGDEVLARLCAALREAAEGDDAGAAGPVLAVLSSARRRCDAAPPLVRPWLSKGSPLSRHAMGALLAQASAGASLEGFEAELGEAARTPGLCDAAFLAIRAEFDRSRDPLPAVRAALPGLRGPWHPSVPELVRHLLDSKADLSGAEPELRDALRGAGSYLRDVLLRALTRVAARRGVDALRAWLAHPNARVVTAVMAECEALGVDPAAFTAEIEAARASGDWYLRDTADRWLARPRAGGT